MIPAPVNVTRLFDSTLNRPIKVPPLTVTSGVFVQTVLNWSAHYDLVWDASNRLVEVKDGAATMAQYESDGLGLLFMVWRRRRGR